MTPAVAALGVTSTDALVAHLAARAARAPRPLLVALDGRSGAGKSTLAAAVAGPLAAAVIAGDDFFAGGVVVRTDSPAARAAACIDWRRQRAVLTALRAGQPASWAPFDWDAFDGSLAPTPVTCLPAPVVILEGVYSGRPALADLVDVRVVLDTPIATCRARLLAREGSLGPWEQQWHEAEDHYFAHLAPPSAFDVIVTLTPA